MSLVQNGIPVLTFNVVFYSSLSVAAGVVLWAMIIDKAAAATRKGQQHPLGWQNKAKS